MKKRRIKVKPLFLCIYMSTIFIYFTKQELLKSLKKNSLPKSTFCSGNIEIFDLSSSLKLQKKLTVVQKDIEIWSTDRALHIKIINLQNLHQRLVQNHSVVLVNN